MNELKVNKSNKSITFINNGIAFSQFGIADEILDLVDNQDKEIERLNNIIDELEKWLKEEKQKFLNSENVIFSNVEDLTLTSVINKLKELKEGK